MDFPKIARRAAFIMAGLAIVLSVSVLAYTQYPKLIGPSHKVWATIEAERQANLANLNKAVVAPPAVTTEAVTTDTGRAGYVKTTKVFIDPVVEIETMKKSLASATKTMAEQALEMQRQAAAQVAALTTTFNSTVEGLKAEIAKKNQLAAAPQVTAPAPQAQVQSAPTYVPGPQAQAQSGAGVQLDVSRLPKDWKITGYEKGTVDRDCTTAQGRKVVTSKDWVWRNGRHFFPNECVSLSDPRPAAK